VPTSGPDIPMEVPFQLDGTCTLYPISYTVIQGTPFGGNVTSLYDSDNIRAFVLCDEFAPNSEIECVFDTMTPYVGATYVGNLQFSVETRSTRTDQIEFLKVKNHTTGQLVNEGSWFTTLADSSHTATIINASDFVSAAHLINVRLLVIPTADIDSGDGWTNAMDLVNITCGV